MPNQQKGIENLTKTQATLYRSYIVTNNRNTNQQKEITRLCELGKEGHAEIVAIAEVLKANAERTATIKVQVSRAMAILKTGLTLQGLGNKDDEVFIGLKNTDNEPLEAPEAGTKPESPEASVEANTKVFDFDELDRVFVAMATDEQKTMIAHLTKLMKATTKLRIAS
jgi:hypothetical protein